MKKYEIKKQRVSKKIKAISNRPRLIVFRSNREIYAQVTIDSKIIASSGSLKENSANNIERAKKVGVEVGKKLLKTKISEIVFDRRGYKYHGKIKALAEGVRSAGIKF